MSTPRRRIDPRAARNRLRVTSGDRLRIVRDGRDIAATAPMLEPRAQILRIEAPSVWIVAIMTVESGTASRHARQVLGAARLLGAECGVLSVLIGQSTDPTLGGYGADRVMHLDVAAPDDCAQAIASLLDEYAVRHVVFPELPVEGDLARRLAVLTGWSFQGSVEALSPREAIRPVAAGRRERAEAPARIMTLPPDRIAPYAGPEREARLLPAPAQAHAPSPVRPSAPQRLSSADMPLATAPFVIAAGHGVRDFGAFHALARRLGAQEGASRTVCDAGLLPRAAQVGASGTVLDARCYVAFGISGAPQHLQGLGQAEHVIAINTDLHAAIIARAGLAIVADAQAIMPALLAALKETSA